jgi:hypothetical protein
MMLSNDKPVHEEAMGEKLAKRVSHNIARLPANHKLDGTLLLAERASARPAG